MTSESVFPDTLMIRDTGIYDDLGGAGQRIYTTAGQGYEKQKYIRADKVQEMLEQHAAEQREKVAVWMIYNGYSTGHGDTIDDLLDELKDQLAKKRTGESDE